MNRSTIEGALLTLIGTAFYSCQTAIVKAYSGLLPPLSMVIFIQSFISLLLILPYMFRNGIQPGLKLFKTQHLNLQLLRMLFSLSLSFLLYYSVSFISLVDAMLLANAAPLIVPLVAYLLYKQPINKKFWPPAILGFIGVIIILQPDAKIVNYASLLAFGGAICAAIALVLVHHMPNDRIETINFYFFALSTALSGILAFAQWEPFNKELWPPILAIGVCYFLFQFLVTYALKIANARLVGSLLYSSIAFSALIAIVKWGVVPTLGTYIGIALIVTSGFFCIRLESRPQP